MGDNVVPGSSKDVIKNPSGKIVRSGQRVMAYNVYLKYKNKELSKTESVKLTAADVGISEKLLFKIIGEMESTGIVKSPPRKRMRPDLYSKMNEDERKAVRRTVHSFFLKNEITTLDKVLQCVQSNEDITPVSRSSLFRVLKKLGFVWEKRGRNCMLIERDEIILWRREYLTKIRNFRLEGRTIYYLDETWVNADHTKTKIWKDTTIKNARQAFIEGLSVGLNNPSGKGHRLIITHIGNEKGFVDDGLLIFQSKNSNDYHEDMNSTVFEDWLQNVLPSLEENAVIVMNNAPYHSVKIEKTPTTAWKKNDIQTFLKKKGVQSNENLLKVQLLQLAKNYVYNHPVQYKVDKLVKETNREVLRLPPYHCKLNPIELVWAQVKGYVAANNKTFKIADVKNLFIEGLAQVTAEKWSRCIDHVKEEEENLYRLDNIVEEMQLQFVVNTGSSSEESD